MPHGDGLHAHLQIGKTMIMITDEQPHGPNGVMMVASPESVGAATTILEMYVDDVDVVYQRAVDAGGKADVADLRHVLRGSDGLGGRSVRPHLGDSTVREEVTPEQIHERMTAVYKQS